MLCGCCCCRRHFSRMHGTRHGMTLHNVLERATARVCRWISFGILLQSQSFYTSLGHVPSVPSFTCPIVWRAWSAFGFTSYARIWMNYFWLALVVCKWQNYEIYYYCSVFSVQVHPHKLPIFHSACWSALMKFWLTADSFRCDFNLLLFVVHSFSLLSLFSNRNQNRQTETMRNRRLLSGFSSHFLFCVVVDWFSRTISIHVIPLHHVCKFIFHIKPKTYSVSVPYLR